MAVLHGLLDSRFWRVLDAEEPDEHHVVQEILLCEVPGHGVPVEVGGVVGPPLRDAQNALGLAHERLGICGDGLLHLRRHGLDAALAALPHVCELAELRHTLRSALQGEELSTLVVWLRDEHVLVGGVERNLEERHIVHDIFDSFHAPRCHTSLHQSNLGWGTDELLPCADHGGVVANRATQHLGWQRGPVRWVRLAEVRHRCHRRR
mmetsp:Transcript_8374/g.21361  ORF Transcript_8374/g.21361 Transcript_8374/m.21361 type:complete len:207 (+) Transcript_8374:1380-2000(+)